MKNKGKLLLVFPVIIALILAIGTLLPLRTQAMSARSQTVHVGKGTSTSHIHYVRPANYHVASVGQNLSYGGGPVMAGTAQVYAIFWEPTGSSVSANYNSLILRYFGDVGNTGLYANNRQYTDSTGAAPRNATWLARGSIHRRIRPLRCKIAIYRMR